MAVVERWWVWRRTTWTFLRELCLRSISLLPWPVRQKERQVSMACWLRMLRDEMPLCSAKEEWETAEVAAH